MRVASIPEVSLLNCIFKKPMVATFVLCILLVAVGTGFAFTHCHAIAAWSQDKERIPVRERIGTMGLFGKLFGSDGEKEKSCCEMEIVELPEGEESGYCM